MPSGMTHLGLSPMEELATMSDYETLFLADIEELFEYADIDCIELTKIDTVRIDFTVRKTARCYSVEGNSLQDAISLACDRSIRETWILDDILTDYGLDVEDLRELIGPGDAQTNELRSAEVYDSSDPTYPDFEDYANFDEFADYDYDTGVVPPSPATIMDPVLVGAAQPFVLLDGDGRLYLALELGLLED